MESLTQEAVPELSGRMDLDLKNIVKAITFGGFRRNLGIISAARGMDRQKSANKMPVASLRMVLTPIVEIPVASLR